MERERLTVFAIAMLFYVAGGWSLYGEYDRANAGSERSGKWQSTTAMISAAYAQDAADHDIGVPRLLGYKYIVNGVQYEVTRSSSQNKLASAYDAHDNVHVNYKSDDPSIAVLVGDPRYSIGLGLIALGTLLAAIREAVTRRSRHGGRVR